MAVAGALLIGSWLVLTGSTSLLGVNLTSHPLDAGCGCVACRGGYSRSYLRHLYVAGEILVHRLLSLHNLWFYERLVREARIAIEEDRYVDWAESVLGQAEPLAGSAP